MAQKSRFLAGIRMSPAEYNAATSAYINSQVMQLVYKLLPHPAAFISVRKTPLFAPFIYINASFHQDRLGTNIGKALKKRVMRRARVWTSSKRVRKTRQDKTRHLNTTVLSPLVVILQPIILPRQARDKCKRCRKALLKKRKTRFVFRQAGR